MLPFGEPEPMFTATARAPLPVLDAFMPGIPAAPMLTGETAGPVSGFIGLVACPRRTAVGFASWFGTEAGIAWPRFTFTGAGGGVTFFGGAGAITTGFGMGTSTGLISGTLTGSGILILGVSIFGGGGVFTFGGGGGGG